MWWGVAAKLLASSACVPHRQQQGWLPSMEHSLGCAAACVWLAPHAMSCFEATTLVAACGPFDLGVCTCSCALHTCGANACCCLIHTATHTFICTPSHFCQVDAYIQVLAFERCAACAGGVCFSFPYTLIYYRMFFPFCNVVLALPVPVHVRHCNKQALSYACNAREPPPATPEHGSPSYLHQLCSSAL